MRARLTRLSRAHLLVEAVSRLKQFHRGEEELVDIELGDREYQFGKGKETMVDDDKTTFNSLISIIKELTTGKKEMMSTFRQMTEKNGPTPHSPLFPNNDRVSTSSSGEHLHTNMQSHPHIYNKPS